MKSKIEKLSHLKRIIKINNINISKNDFDSNQYIILGNDKKELIMYWLKDDFWYVVGTSKSGNGITNMMEEYNKLNSGNNN